MEPLRDEQANDIYVLSRWSNDSLDEKERKSEGIKGSTSIKSQKFYMMYEDKHGRWLMRCFSHMCPSIIRLAGHIRFL